MVSAFHCAFRVWVNLNPISCTVRIDDMTLIKPPARLMPCQIGPRLCAVALLCLLAALPAQAQSVSQGRRVFESVCMKCHQLDTNFQGPALRTVVGRTAGKAPGYFYSEALEAATHVWDRAKLKAWLTDPESVVPGQDMNFHLDSARDRDDVVAYLASLSRRSLINPPVRPHSQPPPPPPQ